MRTLLSGAVVVTCDEQVTVYSPGDVLIVDDRIAYVGPRFDGEWDERLPLGGYLLMPGLVNAHTHSGMSLFRTMSDDVDLKVFLEERVWPREINLTEDDVYVGSVLSAAEMLKSGVTTYVDMYFFEEALVRAAVDTGARALVTPTIIQSPVWLRQLGRWEQQLVRVVEFAEKWDGHEGRIHLGLGPHAPYTLPLDALDATAGEARRLDVPVNIHLVEAAWERELFAERHLGSTVQALDDIGFFEGKVIAAHSIWIDPGDLEIFRRRNVGVVHCPQSNSKLGAGVAHVAAMLACAINVGLGTDGASTNNNLDVWEEMRLAPLLAKVTALDPKPVRASEALSMATRLGGLAAHLPHVGVLAEGYKADLIMLNLSDTTMVPIFGPESYISHLVYSAGRELVHSVWVNGQRVVRDRELTTIDESEARAHCQKTAIALAERVS